MGSRNYGEWLCFKEYVVLACHGFNCSDWIREGEVVCGALLCLDMLCCLRRAMVSF